MKNNYTFVSSWRTLIGRRVFLLVAMLCTAALQIVNAQVSVTATAGTTGPTTYTTVSAAFAAINAGTHQGAITVQIVANTTEPGSPTALAASASPSNYTSVRIEPSGGNYTIGGTATANRAIIELNGADNVTIDGDDPTVAGTRNLTIGFASTSATIAACIRVSSASTLGANGATNNIIRNCIITGNRVANATTVTYGINMSNYSTTSLSTGGYSSINNRFENNLITRCYHGIWASGFSSTYPNTGLRIVNNVLGDNTAAGNIGLRAILVTNCATNESQSAIISGNQILGVGDPGTTGFAASIAGIELGTTTFGTKIFNNLVQNVKQPNIAGYGSHGVLFSGANSCDSMRFYNNIVQGITASNFTQTALSGFVNYGVRHSAGAAFADFSNNTIVLNVANPTGTTSNSVSYALAATVNGVRYTNFRNNIIVNTLASTNAVGIYVNSSAIYTASNYPNGRTWDRNCYWVPSGVLGFSASGVAQTSLAAWRTETGVDGASFNVLPNFVSPTDMHINGATGSLLESGGMATAFNTDYDGQDRPGPAGSVNGGATSFDVGADEFDGIPIYPVSITSASATASSCTAIAHTVTATVVQGTNPITSVTLSYTLNGTAQTPITMSNTGGNTWEANIPAASPTNATIVWTVTAADAVSSPTATGSYQDDALLGIGLNTSATPTSVCTGSNSSLLASAYNPNAAPTTYTIQQVTNATTDEDLGNVTITDAATSTVLLNNTSTYNSLVGTLGTATGNAGSYANYMSFTTVPMTAGSTYNFSLSSLQGPTAYGNAMAIYIDLNRDGDYADAGEALFNEAATALGARTITGSFTIPATANNGLTRMRVMINEGLITSPTMTVAYGEREEYLVNISSANNGGGGNIPTFTWSWSDGSSVVGTTNPLSTTVTTGATFTVTASTSSGCTVTGSISPSTIPLPSAPTATNSMQCGAGVPTASVASTTGLPTPTFRWYADQTGGTALQSSASTSYGTSVSTTDTLWVSEFDGTCESSRTPVIVTINTPPAITTSASTTICSGQSTTLTVSSSNPGYSYTWNNNAGTGASVSVAPMTTTTYTVTALDTTTGETNSGCIITATTTITVNASPTAVIVSPSDTSICQGSSVTLNTTGGTNSGVFISGPLNTVNGTTGYPAPFTNYYGGNKHQLLFTAAELTALGYQVNDRITSLGFAVFAVGSTFSGTLNNFNVAMKHTTATTLTTTFETGLTSLANLNVTIPTTGLPLWIIINLGTPFTWDGTSNLVIQTSYSNGNSGTTTDWVQTYLTNVGSTMCSWYRADGATAATVLAATTATATGTNRPDVRLGWERTAAFAWSPITSTSTAPSVTPSNTTIYSVVATNQAGCTSTGSANVNVNPLTSDTTTASACDSYTWSVNGTTYTSSGTYSVVNGCNTSVLILTITNSTSNTSTVSACDSYAWSVNGQSYTQSGTYSSVSGCNTEILVLTIAPSSNNTTTASACDNYVWSVNGTNYTQSGTYTSITGCATEILSLTINPSTSNVTSQTATNSYTWSVNGQTYTQSGTYSSVTGCATEILTLTINTVTCSPNSSSVTASACDSYSWNGNTYTASGTYTWTGTNAGGCDSVVTLALTITASTSNSTTASSCGSYTWNVNGTTYTQSGTYSSVSGCNTEILNLTVTPSTSNTTTQSACDSYTWSVNGTAYTQSGTYSSVNGCNTETLVLTIAPSSSNTTSASACDSYTWSVNGTTYTQSGTYSSVNGCATEILSLTITPASTNNSTVSACDSYTWSVNGTTYTQSGTYSSVNVCATEILVLTINPATTNTTTAAACDSYTWSVDGNTYTQSGTYSSVNGCNTEILALTIIPVNNITTTASACGSYTWSYNGQTYTQSGTYTVAVTGATVTGGSGGGMRISQVYGGGGGSTGSYLRDYVELYNSSCSPINIGGWSIAYGSSTGNYGSSASNVFTFPAGTTVGAKKYVLIECGAAGTAGTALPVTADFATPTTGFSMSGTAGKVALFNTTISNVACSSLVAGTVVDRFSWGTGTCAEGTARTAPSATQVMVRALGGETDTDNNNNDFTNTATSSAPPRNSSSAANTAAPCPVACTNQILNLTITPSTSNTTTASACDSYTWSLNGTTYTQSGTYSSVTGCNTEILALTITPSTSNTTTASACDSYTWSVNGNTYTQSGTYSSVNGCNTEILNLTVGTTSSNTTTAAACNSYTWSVNGTTYTQSGTYSSVSGCATEVLALTITSSTSNSTTASACDSYTWSVNGSTYTQSGTYSNVNGCHTETLVLTVTPSSSNTTTASSCDSYTWIVNGTTYTQSGTYSVVNGCQTEILSLTITGTATTNTTSATGCDSYTWVVNGTTYTQSGSYTSLSGCNTDVLNLTIVASTSNTSTASSCDSYTWSVNGQTYTQSGSYSNVSGCHTEILTLTITPSTSNTTTATACDSYTWSVDGNTYTQSGSYSSTSGCNTEILALTITSSSSNTTTASACDSYTWSVDGNTYTASGTYSSVNGCHTEILALAITASTSNTSSATGCDNYTWNVNGTTYTQSGTYSSVSGCHTEILNLTITPSTSSTSTASACDTYTWSVDGNAYTQSGTYSSVSGCHTTILALTIIPSTSNTTTASACNSYAWSFNGQTYTQSGTYSVAVSSGTSGGGMRISQVYSGGGGTTGSYQRDYVELYNSSCSPINIGGWSIAYGSATGNFASSTGNIFTFPAGTTVGAKKYVLIECGAAGTSGTALPVSADFATPTTGFSMSGTSGKVGLFNTTISSTACSSLVANTVVDKFSWGTGNCPEGTAKTAPSTTQVMARGLEGETDTDNNNSDFTNTATSSAPPRNSASAANTANPCPPACHTEILALTIIPQPAQPNLACYETATFNTTTCSWDVTGTQPAQPSIACYETATFNGTTCQWDVTGTQPTQPSIACYETATFNGTTCQWDVTGTQPAQPSIACYETATFNTTTCSWDVTGTQPAQPSIACYETATFNGTTCQWDVTGTQPTQPSTACYETATFNGTTCQWDVTGTQPAQPSIACYETATFNTTTCSWDVTGTQPAQPSIACYETATFNGTTCQWDVTGTQPVQPSIACYETATFNTTTCSWDVTGTQPAQPSIACYETATFNGTTCQWDVTGTQPAQPSIACYETATFNGTTCQWDVTGTPNAPVITPATGCDSYTWAQNGNTYTASGTYTSTSNCQDYILNLTITTSTIYYADGDGDGYGSASSTTNSCNGAPSGYVSQSGDCDDTNVSINPGASELCNGIDDNCDNLIDNGTAPTAGGTIGGVVTSCRAGVAGTTTFTISGVTSTNGFAWTVPSGFTLTSGQGSNSITVSFTGGAVQSGIVGQLCAISTDVCGSTVSTCANIDYQVATPVTPPSISGPSKVCAGETATYSIASVARASSYNWTVPTGASIVSGQGTNVISVTFSGGYTGGSIDVTASNVCGISPVRSKNITLLVLPAPAAINGIKFGLCNASGVVYNVGSVSGATSYLWSVTGGGTIVSGQGTTSITVNFPQFTSGNVNVQAVNGCGASLVRSVYVTGAPGVPDPISGASSACANSTQAYSVATVNGTAANGYAWTITPGGSISSGQGTKNITVNWGAAITNQAVRVTASNACGTGPAVSKTGITVTNCAKLEQANGGLSLDVYPNPADNFTRLVFTCTEEERYTLRMTDMSGRLVLSQTGTALVGPNNLDLQLGTTAPGVYFIELQTGDQLAKTRLVVN